VNTGAEVRDVDHEVVRQRVELREALREAARCLGGGLSVDKVMKRGRDLNEPLKKKPRVSIRCDTPRGLPGFVGIPECAGVEERCSHLERFAKSHVIHLGKHRADRE